MVQAETSPTDTGWSLRGGSDGGTSLWPTSHQWCERTTAEGTRYVAVVVPNHGRPAVAHVEITPGSGVPVMRALRELDEPGLNRAISRAVDLFTGDLAGVADFVGFVPGAPLKAKRGGQPWCDCRLASLAARVVEGDDVSYTPRHIRELMRDAESRGLVLVRDDATPHRYDLTPAGEELAAAASE